MLSLLAARAMCSCLHELEFSPVRNAVVTLARGYFLVWTAQREDAETITGTCASPLLWGAFPDLIQCHWALWVQRGGP